MERTLSNKKTFKNFIQARAYARSLKMENAKAWQKWSKSDARPADIPSAPDRTYKQTGWINWRDWLGYTIKKRKNRLLRPFQEARAFVRTLGLKNVKQWREWCKSGARPGDIPAGPNSYYSDKGWIDWNDFLGNDNFAPQKHILQLLTYEEAHEVVAPLNLKSRLTFDRWVSSDSSSSSIPRHPDRYYFGKGWISWKEFLKSDFACTGTKIFVSFEQMREFVKPKGFKSSAEYYEWAKSGDRPENIPAVPSQIYKDKGWKGWKDFLDKPNFLPYEQARAKIRLLGIKSNLEYRSWARSENRPNNIPATPDQTYKTKGWTNWHDYLNENNRFLAYEEARARVRLLRLENSRQYDEWAKSDERPHNIPLTPDKVYRKSGWKGWSHYLNKTNIWNRNAILNFVQSIEPHLSKLEPKELHAIMLANGMAAASQNLNGKYADLLQSLREIAFSSDKDSAIQSIVDQLMQEENNTNDELYNPEAEVEQSIIPSDVDVIDDLPTLQSFDDLKAVDDLVATGTVSDIETIEFLICNKVSGIWQLVLTENKVFSVEDFRIEKGGHYFSEIKQRFFEQYQGAENLPVPIGYSFHKNGGFAVPNLMQRLTAYRVMTEKRIGNWSGVGAGKTISAILTSRVINARLTVIIAFNSTIEMWAQAILEVFPDSNVIIKEHNTINFSETKNNYLLLNFESFQQPDAENVMRQLLKEYRVDFVVLDEIHNAKQRYKNFTSLRRNVITNFLRSAENKNSNLRVLGMSATPVINNLYEAKALLELTTGKEFADLETSSNVSNALAIHQQLLLNGLRYKPAYKQSVETIHPIISGDFYCYKLLAATKGSILAVERILLEAKLPVILSAVRKGTMIYSQYVEGLVDPLRRILEEAGYKVGIFTGQDKSGLQQFIQGKVDVLIGSKPVGTGIDGLQYVCNQMIVVCLPWTNAEYEQLIGRLHRQGAKFNKVTVIIPQVVLSQNDDVWSWDQMRLNRIEYKKTLADAAIDGIIPEGSLASEKTLLQNANEALRIWIARLENNENYLSKAGSSM